MARSVTSLGLGALQTSLQLGCADGFCPAMKHSHMAKVLCTHLGVDKLL